MIVQELKAASMIETYRGVVYPDQLDHMGHMNVRWYSAKYDEASWQLFSALGLTADYIQQHQSGMAALEQTIKYNAEVHAGNLLVIKSRVTSFSNKIIRFKHIMFNSESMSEVSRSTLIAIHMDLKSRRSSPLPDFVKDRAISVFKAEAES